MIGAAVGPFQLAMEAVAAPAPLDAFAGQLYAAVGLRRMLSSYTGPLIRVRRSSDNAQQDFGAGASGWLDTAALLAWAGGASVYLTTLYEQTGGGRHAVQATTTQQPRIVNAGVLDVGPGGRPVARFDGTDDLMTLDNSLGCGRAVGSLTLAAVGWSNNATGTFVRVVTQVTAVTRLLIQREAVGGRRLSAQSYSGVTGSSPGSALVRVIGRARYSQGAADVSINGTVTTEAFQNAGLTDDLNAAAAICIGAATTTQFLSGAMSCAVISQSSLDIPMLNAALSQLMP